MYSIGNNSLRRRSEMTMVIAILLSVLFASQNVDSFTHVSVRSKGLAAPKSLISLAQDRQKGYTFFQSSGQPANDSKAKKGYVPSGLSREEYAAIRKKEADREKKMNYGAWGPRFFRTDRPDGDWMVMPNLWTFGQVDNTQPFNTKDGAAGDAGEIRYSIRRRIQILANTHGAALLLGYIMVDSLYFGYVLWKLKQSQNAAVLQKASGLAYAMCSLLLTTVGLFAGLPPRLEALKAPSVTKAIQTSILGPAAIAVVRINALKLAVAMLQIPLWNKLMELSNRRWLWSKKRFTTISSLAMTGLTFFGMVMFR